MFSDCDCDDRIKFQAFENPRQGVTGVYIDLSQSDFVELSTDCVGIFSTIFAADGGWNEWIAF